MDLKNIKLIEIPRISDPRGNLAVIEKDLFLMLSKEYIISMTCQVMLFVEVMLIKSNRSY